MIVLILEAVADAAAAGSAAADAEAQAGRAKKAARMGCNEMQNGGSNEQYICNNNNSKNNIYILYNIYDYIMSLCHVTTNLTQ